MNYSNKHVLLSEYLDVTLEDILELSPSYYDYNGDEYMILNDPELVDMIHDQVEFTAEEVQHSIDLGQDHMDFCFYIDMKVDREAIKKDIESNLGEYIGTGTYEEFKDHYIFLMQ